MNRRIITPLFRRSLWVPRAAVHVVMVVALVAAMLLFKPAVLKAVPVFGAVIDAQDTLSDAQALTVTAFSTNTYDMAAASLDVAVGEPIAVQFTVDVAAKTSNSDETYQFVLVQSANADLSSQDVLYSTDTTFLSRTILVKGKKFFLPIPSGLITKRYFGVRYVLGGTSPTITVTAEVQPLSMVQNDRAYAANFTISS